MKIHRFDSLPNQFLELPPEEIVRVLPGPSLIELGPSREPPLFVSTLLHGNETTGFTALKAVLKEEPRHSMMIFIGNPLAAAQGVRRLPDQPDYNRLWSGGDSEEHAMAQELVEIVNKRKPFACLDIHNTTGRNPHYACVTHLEPHHVSLAQHFSDPIVYFKEPHQVLSAAFADLCPSITMECGLSGEAKGVEHTINFLREVLSMDEVPTDKITAKIFHSVLRVKIPEGKTLAFGGGADFTLDPEIDLLNFKKLAEPTHIGTRKSLDDRLLVLNERNEEVTEGFVEYKGQDIFLSKNTVPSMLTTNSKIACEDSLCYLMEEVSATHQI